MIRYALRCGKAHDFEAWFASGATYDSERKKRRVECPVCGDRKIAKAPMAPSLSRGRDTQVPNPAGDPGTRAKVKQYFTALRRHVEENFENVGTRFPEEARKMHYGETEDRAIFGDASPDEARELVEEGIEIAPLPDVEQHDA